MIYNITTYGTYRTSYVSYTNPKDARRYLTRKRKDGFHFIQNVDGETSEYALAVGNGRVNVWISNH